MEQQRIELVGKIIVSSGAVESALRRRGATGAGIHELTDSLGDALPPEAVRLLHYIAAVRNKAAHEGADAELTDFDPAFFAEACAAVLRELDGKPSPGAAPAAPTTPAEPAAPAPPAAPTTPVAAAPAGMPAPASAAVSSMEQTRFENSPMSDPDVPPSLSSTERETSTSPSASTGAVQLPDLSRNMRRAALIPILHLLYPVWLLLRSLRPAIAPGLGMAAYGMAILLAVIAARTGNAAWLYPAGLLLAGAWLYGAVDGWRRRKLDPLPQLFYLAPGINLFYLLYRIAGKTDKLQFFGSLTLLGAAAVGIYLPLCHREYVAGAVVFGAGYLVGAVMALLEAFQARAVEAEAAETEKTAFGS